MRMKPSAWIRVDLAHACAGNSRGSYEELHPTDTEGSYENMVVVASCLTIHSTARICRPEISMCFFPEKHLEDPCSEFVPLIDGPNPVPDTNLKASSSISPNSGPNAARFNKKGFKGKAWTPAESNEKQFIEVDLGDVRGVYGIATKGKEFSPEWVTSYQLLYSTDGASYSYYQDESDNNKVFRGNFDESTEVKHVFKRPFEAKLVRLEPLTWEKKISLRLELLGCSEALTTPETSFPEEEEGRMGNVLPIRPVTTTPSPKECLDPIDLENGALLDSQLSASSTYNSAFTPENARLGSDSAWVPAFADDDQYLQVDFLDEANVTGIITKGREDVPQWVTAYTLSHSNDGIIWNNVKDEDGSVKEFAANYDPFSEVTNELPATIRTRFLRIEPTKWKNWSSMQIEILGCYRPKRMYLFHWIYYAF
ncbi:hemocytin [Trichonephila inaurata madagascariensis]|uniref:Hemocytin n=1 Tax=Trichonephila inaurata madagascariensis TaxID=2747483 RepID=A0A8X6IGS3_9ARAC|nr:hemocytin [Trichonephila inaurata madagascariensis]